MQSTVNQENPYMRIALLGRLAAQRQVFYQRMDQVFRAMDGKDAFCYLLGLKKSNNHLSQVYLEL